MAPKKWAASHSQARVSTLADDGTQEGTLAIYASDRSFPYRLEIELTKRKSNPDEQYVYSSERLRNRWRDFVENPPFIVITFRGTVDS